MPSATEGPAVLRPDRNWTTLDDTRTFRPARAGILTKLAILFCAPLPHAQSRPAAGDSTHFVGVGRLVQVINAVQGHELR